MNTNLKSSLNSLSTAELTSRIADLISKERHCIVAELWVLAGMQRRGTHLDLGDGSLFVYCTGALRMTESAAYRRTKAASLLTQFPIVEQYLLDGRLNLTTLVELMKILTPENHRELFEAASGRSTEDVKKLVVSYRPLPEVKESIRRLPLRPEPPVTFSAQVPVNTSSSGNNADIFSPSATSAAELPVVPVELPRPRIEPIDSERYSIKLTVGSEFMAELKQVRAALGHRIPDGNLEKVLRACIQKTLQDCARQKHAARKRPVPRSAKAAVPDESATALSPTPSAPTPPPAPTEPWLRPPSKRYVAAPVRREAWATDGASCSFIGENGKRCGSTHQLEFDHIV